MKQVMTIFTFTFREGIRKKAFIISTVIILALVLVLAVIPALINRPDAGDPDTADTGPVEKSNVCYYVDEDGLINGAIEALSEKITDTRFEKGDASKIDEYKAMIKNDGKTSLIITSKDQEGSPFITVTTMNFRTGISESYVAEILSDIYIYNTLAKQGIDKDTIEFAQSRLDYTVEYAGDMDFSGYILGMLLIILIFFAVYFYGYGVAMSVATEKTSRVIETLIVSAKPSRILIGKCLGMGAVGLLQFILIVAFGGFCYRFIIPDSFTLFGMELSLSAFTFKSALFTCIFFILGYILYAMLHAVSGAFVSKIEDLNSAMMPVMMVVLISFYVAYFSMMSPENSFIEKITMYVPFCAPFAMPFKLLTSELPYSDLVISVLILIVTIVIVTILTIKIYSASILRFGKGAKLKELLKDNG